MFNIEIGRLHIQEGRVREFNQQKHHEGRNESRCRI